MKNEAAQMCTITLSLKWNIKGMSVVTVEVKETANTWLTTFYYWQYSNERTDGHI